jgi:hypothetical protein
MRLEQSIAALRFDPALPGWLIAMLASLAVLALIPAALRRARGAPMRAAAFAVLLLWLLNPRLVQETRQTLSDVGLLVVDQTSSMRVGQRSHLAESARKALEKQAQVLPDLELRTVLVPEQGDTGTRLFETAERALADIPRSRLAGVVAITDGQVHDVPIQKQGLAMLAGAPLHVLIPAKGEEVDRRLRVIEAPSYGIVGHPVAIKVVIEDLGIARPSGTARLTIRRDGETLDEQVVPIGKDYAFDVPITRGGPTVVEMSAEALPGEVSTINNRAVVTINGVRDRLRVLLVSGEPHAGERTWRRLLKADPSVDLVHFTILRPPEKDDLTPLNELALIAFPVRELFLLKLHEFDLIILDRFQNRNLLPLPYLRNIAEYVRDGGALLTSVGPEFVGPTSLAGTPLAPAIPATMSEGSAVVDGPFRPHVTPLGARHPVTEDLEGAMPLADPHWGSWYRRIQPGSAHGELLMSAPDGAPLLLVDRLGEGRSALLLSDQIWLWSRGHQGGGPQAELLRRIAHWLMKQPELEENALTARVEAGRLIVAQRSTDEEPLAELTVTNPDGDTEKLTLSPGGPGRASASLPATAPGVWKVTDGARTAYAAAGAANPPEIADLRASASRLEPLAAASGGSVHWLDDGSLDGAPPALRLTEPGRDAAGGSWIGLERRHDHLVTGIDALPLLPPWAALLLILGLMIAAWRRESA